MNTQAKKNFRWQIKTKKELIPQKRKISNPELIYYWEYDFWKLWGKSVIAKILHKQVKTFKNEPIEQMLSGIILWIS